MARGKNQGKAGVIVALSLAFVAWSFWPAQAGSSTKGNSADKMSQNFDFVTSPDDGPVDITDVLLGGYVFDDVSIDTVDEGDSGYARMSADRRQLVDADISGNVLSSQTLIRQTFRGTVANGVALEVVADPAAATTPKIVALVFTQTVQGHTEIRDTSNGGTVHAQFDLPAYGGISLVMAQQPHIIGASDEDILIVNQTGSTAVYSGFVVYYLE